MNHAPHQNPKVTGILWVVATPVGHLDDLSPRAQEILTTVPIVAAEDTRVSRRLVTPGKDQQWLSLNEHNEAGRIDSLIEALLAGQDVALVSDAGTPLISDPGYRLVCAAHSRDIRVSPVPGPCAAVAALSASGLACDRFFFEGFLPSKRQARQARLNELSALTATWIVYVPARDLQALADDLLVTLGPERLVTLAREMTKQFETIIRLRVEQLGPWLASDANQLRGEAVVVVEGAHSPSPEISANALANELKQALPPSQAARILARVSGLSRKQAWDLIGVDDSKPQDPAP